MGSMPHPTILMKITARCGDEAAWLNAALAANAAAAKLLRTSKVHADTAVIACDRPEGGVAGAV